MYWLVNDKYGNVFLVSGVFLNEASKNTQVKKKSQNLHDKTNWLHYLQDIYHSWKESIKRIFMFPAYTSSAPAGLQTSNKRPNNHTDAWIWLGVFMLQAVHKTKWHSYESNNNQGQRS